MAITRGTSADLGDKSGTSGTFTTGSFNLGATGQKVILLITSENNGAGNQTVTGASITGGASFSTAIHSAWGTFQTTNFFVLSTSLTGSQTFDVTYTGGVNAGFHVQVVVYDGAGLTGGVVDNTTTTSTTNAAGQSTSITVNTANSFVVMFGTDFNGGIAAGTGATQVLKDGSSIYIICDSNTAQPTGSYTIGYTGTNYVGTLFEGVISLAPFVPSAATASSQGRDFMLTGAF